MILRKTTLASVSIVVALSAAQARADWYGGVDFGHATMSESGAFGVPVAAFPGPTVDHDLCGGTATITLGARPSVNGIDDGSTRYNFFIGKRYDSWSFELGRFNLARLAGSADSGAYAVAQPTCNPVPSSPITVSAIGREIDTVAFSGFSFTPVYSWSFADRWTLDLRATLASWDRTDRSQWQVVVTELQGGNPLQTYPITAVTGSGSDSGFDVWPGLGIGYALKDKVHLRGIVEQENFGGLATVSWTLGIVIDFD